MVPDSRGACHRAGHLGQDPLAYAGYACVAELSLNLGDDRGQAAAA